MADVDGASGPIAKPIAASPHVGSCVEHLKSVVSHREVNKVASAVGISLHVGCGHGGSPSPALYTRVHFPHAHLYVHCRVTDASQLSYMS